VVALKSADYLLPQFLSEKESADAAASVRPPDAWKLIRQLISSEIASGESKRAVRLAWWVARSPIAASRWLNALERTRVRAGVETVPYRLAKKAGQSFLHHSLPQTATINLLTMHFERILAALGPRFVSAIFRGKVVVAAEIAGRPGARYRLCLERAEGNCREGELIVVLVRLDGNKRVASLTVVLGALRPGETPDLWIGGLQGCRGADSKAVTVKATKDLWGLRPKDLLIHAAYGLREALGAANIKAISNAGHVHQPTRHLEPDWCADYDAFWRELGGEPIAGDFFLLPGARHRRSVEEVPLHKRSPWRRRYALVDEIGADIRRLAIKPRAG
jgi:uncharacterized protein VirK/YbjX